MSAPIVIPFNYNPESTQVITGTSSITIPTGKYAFVSMSLLSGQSFINSVLIARQSGGTIQSGTTTSTSTGQVNLFTSSHTGIFGLRFTFGNTVNQDALRIITIRQIRGGIVVGQFDQPIFSTSALNLTSIFPKTQIMRVQSGDVFSRSSNGSLASALHFLGMYGYNESFKNLEFILNEGDVLSFTSAQASGVVQYFNRI